MGNKKKNTAFSSELIMENKINHSMRKKNEDFLNTNALEQRSGNHLNHADYYDFVLLHVPGMNSTIRCFITIPGIEVRLDRL